MASGRYVDPNPWKQGGEEAVKKTSGRSISTWTSLLAKVLEAHQMLLSAGKTVTTYSLRNKLTGKAEVAFIFVSGA